MGGQFFFIKGPLHINKCHVFLLLLIVTSYADNIHILHKSPLLTAPINTSKTFFRPNCYTAFGFILLNFFREEQDYLYSH